MAVHLIGVTEGHGVQMDNKYPLSGKPDLKTEQFDPCN
jgi:hypothetical protein